ncbi:MAG: ribonuclease HIII [Lentisphaeria bacterium]|nr:ribonuclease HIII [Lentisphaeria bacterium]
MPPISFIGYELTSAEIETLHAKMAEANWLFSEVQYAHWRGTQGKVNITAYLSGKVTFQGAGCEMVAEYFLPGKAAAPSKKQPQARKLDDGRTESALEVALRTDPAMFEPHAGIDESGKGDFFGPLVIACAYTDAESAARLLDAGVRDSKLLSSDAEAKKLATTIHNVLNGRYSFVIIRPERLNEMHAQSGNLNSILAWGHATALEELLTRVPPCPRAISDPFGRGNLVRRHLKERGKGIALDEHPKAEADIAVAAASILARAIYIKEVSRLSESCGLTLPKGCSQKVVNTAREFLKLHSKEALAGYAKTFFKTFEQL